LAKDPGPSIQNPPTEKVALKIMKKAWVLLFEKKGKLSAGV
jgi:hypothetical protein